MKARLIGHAIFFVVAALLAWRAWNVEDATPDDEAPTIVDLAEDQLKSVRFTWPEGELSLLRAPEREPVRWAVNLSRDEKVKEAPAAPAGDAGVSDGDAGPAAPPPPPRTERKESSFPAGRTPLRSVERLAPLKATRKLGAVAADKLADMGLEEPDRKLIIESTSGKSWTLEVGAATYGNRGRYVREAGKSEVYLLDAAAIRGLEGPPRRLMEARVLPVPLEEITAVQVAAGDRRAEFTQVEREQPKKRHFVAAGAGGERSEEASGMVSTLRGLRVKSYVPEERVKDLLPLAVVTVQRDEAKPVSLTLFATGDEEGKGFLVQVGRWVGELAVSRGKNALEDIQAALPVASE
jgi:hypothetical protein